MKVKGFTLIELLAVILILAMLALIAVPIVLNIIGNAKDSAVLNSGINYLRAVEQMIMDKNMSERFNPSECEIQSDGNLICDGNTRVEVKIDGSKPSEGIITINKKVPVSVDGMILDGYVLNMPENGNLVVFGRVEDITPQGTYLMVSGNIREDAVFLGGTIKKNEVESITIKNRKNVPSDAIGSWDVSEAKDSSVMAWYTDSDNDGLYELYIGGDGGVKANPDSRYLFSNFINVEQIDVTYLNTSDVTNMNYMFDMKTNTSSSSALTSDSKLTSIIGLEKFNTSQVTTMNRMFIACSNLQNLNLSNFNTSNVTSMINMFSGCSKLTTLDVSNFDTSKVTAIGWMFAGFKGTNLNVNNFNTSNVLDMHSVFDSCSNLKSLDLSKWDTSKVTDMTRMFSGCSKLENLEITSFNTNNVTNMKEMFSNCQQLSVLDISSINTSEVTDMTRMFSYCSKLETINMKNLIFTNVTTYTQMFNSNPLLKSIIVKDAAAKTFIEARLTDANKTGVTVTIEA